jgi:hypothetical protein
MGNMRKYIWRWEMSIPIGIPQLAAATNMDISDESLNATNVIQ